MARHTSTTVSMNTAGLISNKWQQSRSGHDSWSVGHSGNSFDDQRYQQYLERHRILSSKVERCTQELIDRVRKENPTLDFELLAPPVSHQAIYFPLDGKEFYFDFYLVWKNTGSIHIDRDSSSVCCQIKSLERTWTWSRAEQARLLLNNLDRKRTPYLNGRGLRDLLFEALHQIAPDLIRLDFLEHLIYFDLIIPVSTEKLTCHLTLLPCIHRTDENEVLLPFGTLRWYPRSLQPIQENSALISFQQPLYNISIRHYISSTDVLDESTKLTKKDQQAYARIRTIIHELLLPTTLVHVDSIELLKLPFELGSAPKLNGFFIPHHTDRNCNVFPAGQYLLSDARAKRFFREFVRINAIIPIEHQSSIIGEEL